MHISMVQPKPALLTVLQKAQPIFRAKTDKKPLIFTPRLSVLTIPEKCDRMNK